MSTENNLVLEPDEEHPVSDRTYRIANICTAAFVAGLGAFLLISGIGYGVWDGTRPGPGFFPVCIGIVVLLLGVIWLMQSVLNRLVREDDSTTPDRQGARNILLSIGCVIGFAVLIDLIGFVADFALMLFILFAVIGRRRWWIALLVSIVTTALITLLFRNVLGVPLPLAPIPFLNVIGV